MFSCCNCQIINMYMKQCMHSDDCYSFFFLLDLSALKLHTYITLSYHEIVSFPMHLGYDRSFLTPLLCMGTFLYSRSKLPHGVCNTGKFFTTEDCFFMASDRSIPFQHGMTLLYWFGQHALTRTDTVKRSVQSYVGTLAQGLESLLTTSQRGMF